MRDFLFILGSEKKMVRDYAIAAIAIGCLAYFVAQGIVSVIGAMSTPDVPKISAAGANGSVKTYTVTRSVLDDQIATGSIQSLNQIKLDPCKK